MVSTGYIFSHRLKFKQLTKNIPNVENIFVCLVFFFAFVEPENFDSRSLLSPVSACVSACPFLCLLLIFSLFSSSFLTVTVVRVDKSAARCGPVVLNQQMLFAAAVFYHQFYASAPNCAVCWM